MKESDQITAFEHHDNWQATVAIENEEIFVLMRGQPGGKLEGRFFLYIHDWSPDIGPTPQEYSLDQIRRLFANERLVLIRGSIP